MSGHEESLAAFRGRLYGSAISTYAVCVLIVPLKLWCRVSKGGALHLGWDDALCVVALVFVTVFFFIGMLGLGPDLGKHVKTEVSIPELATFLEFLFPEQLLYLLCVAFNKFAILAFYWRLFSIKARIPLLIMFSIVALWAIGLIIAVVLSCTPIQAQWDPTIPNATCSGLRQLYLGGSVPNILTDILLLIMPIRYVWNLNVRLEQRLMLASIFLLGCFVSVVSIVRLVHLMRVDLGSPDYTWKMKEVLLWSVVEANVGLVCACLPSLKPAVKFLKLDKLFGSRHAIEPEESRRTPVTFSERSKPRKKTLFSSLAGLTQLDSEEEEDSFQMISKVHGTHGTVETKIEPTGIVMPEDKGLPAVINMKRDWSVLVEPQDVDERLRM